MGAVDSKGSYKKLVIVYTKLLFIFVAGIVFLVSFWQATSFLQKGDLYLHVETQDFTSEYAAGAMLRGGVREDFYNLRTQYFWQTRFAPDLAKPHLLRPFFYPPVIALVFVPFTFISLEAAYFLILVINLVLVGYLLYEYVIRRFRGMNRLTFITILLFVLSYPPVVYTLVSGQISFFLVLAILKARDCLIQNKFWQAGVWLSFLVIKPQYLLLPVLYFLYRRDFGVLKGLSIVGAIGVGVSYFILGFAGIERYSQLLMSMGRLETVYAASPRIVATWRGFLELLFGTHDFGSIVFYWAAGALFIIFFLVWTWRREKYKSIAFDFEWSAMILGMMLISLHMSGQDRVLLFIPFLFVYTLSRKFRKVGYLVIVLAGYIVEVVSGFTASVLHLELHVIYMSVLLGFLFIESRRFVIFTER